MIASVALNFFYQPGHIYSSGITGLAQILTTLSKSLIGFEVPVSTTLYLLNIPLFVLAWLKIGKKFTIFTFITVTLTSLCIHILPETVLSTDPIICALFGGCDGTRYWASVEKRPIIGGLDIVSITIRKNRKVDWFYFDLLQCIDRFVAGILFGWQYMFYSTLSIFVSGKVTDVVYTKQKKMQVMIVTKHPEKVVNEIQNCMRRGSRSSMKQKVLISMISRQY